MLEERGLEADPQVCLLPVAVFLKRDSPQCPRLKPLGNCDPQEGWTRVQGVTDSPALHLYVLLWYLGSNLARGLLTTLWRNQTVILSHSPPRLCWAVSRFKCQISPCQAELRTLSKSLLCCQGGTARELSFLCPWLIGKAFFLQPRARNP